MDIYAAESERKVDTQFKEKSLKCFRSQRRIGVGLFGSSSIGTNVLEYNFTSKLAFGMGLGVEEGYYFTKIDKVKISSKYYLLEGPFSPCGVVGYVFKENIARRSILNPDPQNFPYFGLGTQYMTKKGLVVALELDYFREKSKNNFKPGFAFYWFF